MLISGWIGESPKVSEIVLLYNPSLKSREYNATRNLHHDSFSGLLLQRGGMLHIRLPFNTKFDAKSF